MLCIWCSSYCKQIIHIEEPSIAGSRYILLLKDYLSHLRKVYFRKAKDEVFGCIADYISHFKNESGKKILKMFWAESLNTAAYVLNCTVTSLVNAITLFELYYGKNEQLTLFSGVWPITCCKNPKRNNCFLHRYNK